MDNIDYKAAYERQKKARERVEGMIELRSRELYDINLKLTSAYDKLKQQKLQLVHQEKLASVGQLSAGIAHEINNPVGFIKGNLASLKNYVESIQLMCQCYKELTDTMMAGHEVSSEILKSIDEKAKEVDLDYILDDLNDLIAESIDGTARIEEIVLGLKNFSRIDSDKKEVLLVNDCIENTIKLVNNEVKYKADIVLNLNQLSSTMGYPGSLSQVVLNLIVNACHAIDQHGKITITTTEENGKIFIKVEDTGCGMDEKIIKQIFDPFYTTKEAGVGTGLGLSISMGIIKKHQGEILVESEVGKGTCFTLILPVIEYSEE